MTEIYIYKPSVIENGFFNNYGIVSWSQSGTGTWDYFIGYAQHNSDGASDLIQSGVLKKNLKYKISLKISDIGAGQNVTIYCGTASRTVSANGVHSFSLYSNGNDFKISVTSTFGGKISNVSVVEFPGNYKIDIYDNVNIPITYSIDDLKNPSRRNTSFSKTITIPGTKNNNNIFNEIYEIGSESLFNANKKCGCVVYEDGIQVFKGSMCLDEITRINKSGISYDDIEYNVTLIGELGGLFNAWGDLKLTDLDFSEYDHELTADNIYNSWIGKCRVNGVLTNKYTETLSYTVSSISSVSFDGQDRVKVTFTGSHAFELGEVFGWTTNNLLSGFQTIIDKDSTSITLNLLWSQLTDTTNPTGTFTDFTLLGEGYVYPMIEMGESINGTTHDLDPITEGPLEIGTNYIIKKYFFGDDFLNVGASTNTEGYVFTATGTTPTTWTNGSTLVKSDIENWRVSDFYTAIYINEIIKKSFKLIGYNYNFSLLETPIFKRLILPWPNGDTFTLSTARKRQIEFRASMQDTVTEPSGHTFESTYNLYPFPNIIPFNAAPASFFPVNIDYSSLFPADTYAVASHHRIQQSDGAFVSNKTDVVPFNNDSAPTDYDDGNNYDNVLYQYEFPVSNPFGADMRFYFKGQCWHYVKNPTAYDPSTNPTGDFPSDWAGTGAPGIYSSVGVNGKLIGSIPTNANPAYDERGDLDLRPYNAILFQKSTDGGSNWTNIGVLSANGLLSSSVSDKYWNGDVVQGHVDTNMQAGDLLRVIVNARARVVALRSDGKPCTGASSGGSAGTGSGSGGTGGPVKMTIRIDNAVFSASMKATQIPEGFEYDVNSALPNMRIADFFKSICNHFNLLLDPDKSDSKLIHIETRNDYYSLSNPKDWTSKLAINQPIVIKPMGELNARNYIFRYSEGSDFFNADFKRNYSGSQDRTYGDKIVTVNNDFVTDKSETKLIFTPTPIVGNDLSYASSDKLISTNYTVENDGSIKKISGLKILLYNIRGTDISWNLIRTNPNFTPEMNIRYKTGDNRFQFYPQAIHLDNHLSPNFDLNFDIPLYTYYTPEVYTQNNTYNLYHKNFIEEITDRDSKTVTAWLYLTPRDILELDFRNLIVIDGILLRLKKIVEYSVGANTMTKCEFIKVKK